MEILVEDLSFCLAVVGGAVALLGGLTGSSVGIGHAASAGTAALAEDPKQFRNVFLLAALPMTQTFYGLITMIQVLTYLGSIVGEKLTIQGGLAILSLGVLVAVTEFFSAKIQGAVCASGIVELPRTRGKITFNTMILAVYVELMGILGMVFALMALSMLQGNILPKP